MNRAVIILCSFLIFIVTVAFISINEKGEERETVTLKECSTEQGPDAMPYLIPNPMVGFPTY